MIAEGDDPTVACEYRADRRIGTDVTDAFLRFRKRGAHGLLVGGVGHDGRLAVGGRGCNVTV